MRKHSKPKFHLRKKPSPGFISFQVIRREKATLEVREVTKLHYCDSTSSNDKFSSYAQSITLIFTMSTTHPVTNDGRPTTMKPTFIALPSLTSHSTFYKCSRSILCKPQDSPHSPLTRLGVIISYSLHLERKITSPSTSIISPYVYSESSDETTRHLYGVPSAENYIIDAGRHNRHDSSISSQSVEYLPRYKHQRAA